MAIYKNANNIETFMEEDVIDHMFVEGSSMYIIIEQRLIIKKNELLHKK